MIENGLTQRMAIESIRPLESKKTLVFKVNSPLVELIRENRRIMSLCSKKYPQIKDQDSFIACNDKGFLEKIKQPLTSVNKDIRHQFEILEFEICQKIQSSKLTRPKIGDSLPFQGIGIKLVVIELLINAIEHGTNYCQDSPVILHILGGQGGIVVSVFQKKRGEIVKRENNGLRGNGFRIFSESRSSLGFESTTNPDTFRGIAVLDTPDIDAIYGLIR